MSDRSPAPKTSTPPRRDDFARRGALPAPPARGEIHLWAIALDPPETRVRGLGELLSGDERARAERFHFDRHRRRFTVGRGALRELLGGYLDREPRGIELGYGEKGKPYLPGGELRFNLSNSSELALVAVAAEIEVGVDLERLRPLPDALDIAERFFSLPERRVLAAVPEPGREEAFFRCWTRKEAYLKAVGDGLTVALDRFDVTLDAAGEARILALDGDPGRAARWTLVHLDPAPGYLGALAVPDPGPWRLSAGRWEPGSTAR
jgi:4'-phosphopantetheinyl transferase